jgi:hypothetical protein
METERLQALIEKSHVRYREFECDQKLEAFGVSNTDGITRTAHRKSDDLGEYLVIQPGSIAYNPYRINVGSVGLFGHPEATHGTQRQSRGCLFVSTQQLRASEEPTMHGADGTLLVMLATIFVAFERIGLAATAGGLGIWLLLR